MQIDVLNNAEVYRMKTIFYDIKSKKRWFSGETYYEECKERTCDYTLRNGKVIDKEAIDFENNKMIKSERYEFVNGLVTKQQIVVPGGFLEEETLFSYDDNEHLLTKETYKNGVLSNRILYKYNNIGRLLLKRNLNTRMEEYQRLLRSGFTREERQRLFIIGQKKEKQNMNIILWTD